MANNLIIEFWVKPSGVFASKRYTRVYVDDNGNVTRQNVPGKEAINLNSINDYKSTNFPYSNGQFIGDFCNTTTFTNYRLYASFNSPFMTVQTDLNAPKCGYLEPLPTPAVPPNPFGTAVYNLYAKHLFCDVDKTPFSVNIYRKNLSGAFIPFEIEESAVDPISLDVTGGDDKFTPMRVTECTFTFIAKQNFEFSSLYTFDQREFKLEVKNELTGDIKFIGFIQPDNAQELFVAPPYEISVRATDGLGELKKIPYPFPVGSKTDVRQKFTHILAYALAQTNLNLDIMTACNIYATGMLTGINDDPLDQASVSPLRMSDSGGRAYSCFEALEAVCTQFGASLSQVDGVWRFMRVNEFARGNVRFRRYDYTARFKIGGTLATLRIAGDNSQDVILSGGSHNLTVGNPYKYVKVIQEFGRAVDVIYNGDFTQWDGQNFNYWTRYGAINVSRVQKSVVSATGTVIPIDDWACRFNERANSGKWLEDSPTWVNIGQTAKLTLNIGKTDGIHDFKVRFKVGEYYLTNDSGNFEWIRALSTTSIRVDNTSGDIFTFSISIEIPAFPISGDLIVQFYGFTKLVAVNSGSTPPSGARPSRGVENGVGGTVITYYEVDDYTPIDIDNIAISTTVDDSKKIKGIVNVSAQNGFYTESPDDITVIWGEFRSGALNPYSVSGSFVPARPPRNGIGLDQEPQAQLQTIYIQDGTPATGWFEYGESNTPLPIALTLARAILKAYQKSYRFMEGDFIGDNLSYLDSFNIIVPNESDFSQKIFVWQNATFSIKNKSATGKMVEIFSGSIVSNDTSSPIQPGDDGGGIPPIVQNPNAPSQIIGIFTEEFTPEFT